jgi:tetratricopeptide (TPR) repeat protein
MTIFRKSVLVLLSIAILAAGRLPAQTEEANRIFGQAGAGTLTIVAYGADKAEIRKGSALALAEDVVATAYHVISDAFDAEAINSKGKKVKVEGVLGVDKARDIVLLKLKGKAAPLPIGTADNLVDGARVYALGSNNQAQLTIAEGTLRRVIDLAPEGRILAVAMTSAPDEFRGGPLLDVNGQLIGMLLVIGDRGLKFGLPVGVIVGVTRNAKAVDFKSWKQDSYLETAEGNFFAGKAAAALDEGMTARLHMEKAVKIDPSFLAGYVALADICLSQRDYTAALAAYQKVVELDASKADAYYGMGSVLLKQSRWKEAADAMQKAISLDYTGKDVYFGLGTAREELQDFAGAAEAYERYISLKPEAAWNAYMQLGICRTRLGQFDAAVAALLEAEKAQPKEVKVKIYLAEAYEKAGQLENAEGVNNALADLNPVDAKIYHRSSFRMYDGARRYDKAIAPAQKIVALEPQNETNHYYLGLTYFNLQRYDEAITAFQGGLAVKPDFAHAWYQIGSSYVQQKRFKEAAAAYTKFVEISPEEQSGWLSLGVCYMQLKNNEAALEPLRKSTELKPDNGVAWYNLALVYINLKDNYSAKEIYNRLLKIDPALAERLKKYLR